MGSLSLPQRAMAGFTLIDNFSSYATGTPVDGQGDWRAEAHNFTAAGVSVDPLDASNHVLSIGAGGFTSGSLGHRETINTDPAVRIAQGTTGTVFFRLAWNTSQVDFSVGMTDVANPISDTLFNTFTQFESQFAVTFSPGNDKLSMRNGGSLVTLTTDVHPLEWYNVWLAIDNLTDKTKVYIQGGAFATQTQLSYLGTTSFGFRNGVASNDLITFFIATGRNTSNTPPAPTENIGPVYLDDLYVDTSGVNLTLPVPEPSSWALAAAAIIAWCPRLARQLGEKSGLTRRTKTHSR